VDTFGELLAFSGMTAKVTIAYWFDRSDPLFPNGHWKQVVSTDSIKPLDAMYIKMNEGGNFLLLTDDTEGAMAPTKALSAGWNLIGPCPPFFDSGMYVEDAVSSVRGEPGMGYAFVMSPSVGSTQESWVWSGAPAIPGCPCVLSGLGYWVWMDSADTLAGFGFTPVKTLYPKDECPCCCLY